MKKTKIADRIRAAYRPGIGYHELMRLVFPSDAYPNAYNRSNNGGPPGCAMAFNAALRRMGAYEVRGAERFIVLPRAESEKAVG